VTSHRTRSEITSVEYVTADLNTRFEMLERSTMSTSDYAAAEVIALGSAHQIVRGSTKCDLLFDDGPGMPRRDDEVQDDE